MIIIILWNFVLKGVDFGYLLEMITSCLDTAVVMIKEYYYLVLKVIGYIIVIIIMASCLTKKLSFGLLLKVFIAGILFIPVVLVVIAISILAVVGSIVIICGWLIIKLFTLINKICNKKHNSVISFAIALLVTIVII